MTEKTTIHFSLKMRDRWPRPLAAEWQATHPDLFDADDLRLTHTQPEKHFYEWLAAIHLFHRDGALSLIEKYGYANHAHKVEQLDKILGTDGAAFVRSLRSRHNVQPPDLFVYVPGTSRLWFAEVKGPRDSVMPKQADSHSLLADHLGARVELISIREGIASAAR